jgi:protein-arginine kinase activator protein McsA
MVESELRNCPGCRQEKLFFQFTQATGLCDACYTDRLQSLRRAYRKLQGGAESGVAPQNAPKERYVKDVLELAEMDSD